MDLDESLVEAISEVLSGERDTYILEELRRSVSFILGRRVTSNDIMKFVHLNEDRFQVERDGGITKISLKPQTYDPT